MKYDVYGLGNALVDMEYEVPRDFLADHGLTPGSMTLIDEAKLKSLINDLETSGRVQVKKACGGSAANSMIALSQFGGSGFYSCKVANDNDGAFYLKDLNLNKVQSKLKEESLPEGITGNCLVLVTDDAERTMCTFLGVTSSFSTEELDEAALKDSKYIYVEGYLVAAAGAVEAAKTAIQLAKKHKVKTSLTLSDAMIVGAFKENFKALLEDKVDLLFCNEDEAKEFVGESDLFSAREKLKTYARSFVITLGQNGATLWDGRVFIDIEPHQVEAIDSLGAGDMFAGAYLYGITHGHTAASSATLASLACSKIVSQFGPRLSTAQSQLVKKEIFGQSL